MTVELICVSDRPDHLPLLLHALHLQTRMDWMITVLDQSEDGECERVAGRVARHFFSGERRVRTRRVPRLGDWGQTAKIEAAKASTARYLGFPNDDAYYVPTYVELMVAALERGHDLVYCDWVFDKFGYVPYTAKPSVGYIDVGGFLVRRATMLQVGWGSRSQTGDGQFIEAVVASGAPHCRVPGLLYVKN